jgi:hypothetical protein
VNTNREFAAFERAEDARAGGTPAHLPTALRRTKRESWWSAATLDDGHPAPAAADWTPTGPVIWLKQSDGVRHHGFSGARDNSKRTCAARPPPQGPLPESRALLPVEPHYGSYTFAIAASR